jgi:putative nucleotidyltransferase with HDIG domain
MDEASRILLISAKDEISGYLRDLLSAKDGHSVCHAENKDRGIEALKENTFDIIILELETLDLETKQLISDLKKVDPNCIIVALTEDVNLIESEELSRLGIYDFISKPINKEKLFLLIKKGTELHSLMTANHKIIMGLREHNSSLEKQNTLLASRIEELTKNLTRLYEDLRATYLRTIKVLAQAIDARDHYTHSHSENVAKYAVSIAEEMGLSAKEIENIREACELHDLGKIAIQDNILGKEGTLTDEEWEKIRRHPSDGATILEPLTFLKDVIELIRQHHEHYDGSGYPQGRRGQDILLGARIIHLADAYESMRSARSYRKIPLSKEEAILEIKNNNRIQFDPHVVEVFLRIVDNI